MRAIGRRARWSMKYSVSKVASTSVSMVVEQRADRRGRAEARVDPALQGDDEDRVVELGVGEEDDVVVDLVVHHVSPGSLAPLWASSRDVASGTRRRCPGPRRSRPRGSARRRPGGCRPASSSRTLDSRRPRLRSRSLARAYGVEDLVARREARRGRRRGAEQRRRRVLGLGPVDEQEPDVGERVAERADLPVEDRAHAARRRRARCCRAGSRRARPTRAAGAGIVARPGRSPTASTSPPWSTPPRRRICSYWARQRRSWRSM